MDRIDPTIEEEANAGRIAIIGMACRLPGIGNVDALWQALIEGHDTARPIDEATLRDRHVAETDLRDPHYVRSTRSLEGIEDFDAAFFGITPRAASFMDPQQRVFLECCHETLESAGYPGGDEARAIGVFAGSAFSTYMLHHILPGRRGEALNETLLEHAHGNDKDYLTTLVSYRLNLVGPSISVNTACSSALVAVVEACKALLGHDCDMALAGGVRLDLPAGVGYRHRKGGILSPDGLCRPFDVAANGTAFADGAGVVLLKRYDDALADGDHVYATIDGYASNNDGSAKAGYTAPGPRGQEQVLREALAFAGVAPEAIGFIEAHGTGTPVGDPIEFSALAKVYPPSATGRPYCAVGSAKANFGHLNTAAGIVGLMKATLAVYHGVLPRQIHLTREHPALGIEGSAFHIPRDTVSWPADGRERRAGVSSFGIGGSNAHVILGQPRARAATPASGPVLLVLSAGSEAALDHQARQLAAHVRAHPEQSMADVAFTLQQGRRAHAFRAALVAVDRAEAVGQLEQGIGGASRTAVAPKVIWLFPGQGSQVAGMARTLYASEPSFRDEVDRCLLALAGQPTENDVRAALFDEAAPRANETEVAQPALFIMTYALSQVCRQRGWTPDAMLGHSLGEYVAACIAGVMSITDAVRLVALRGRLTQAQAPGSMLAVAAPASAMQDHLHGDVVLAAINGSESVVLAGPTDVLEALAARLDQDGVATRSLMTSHAFHSPSMSDAAAGLRTALATISLSPPRHRYVSNLTGNWIEDAQATDPDYWVRHMLGTVRFAEGLATASAGQPVVFLEVGPGRALSQLVRRQLRSGDRVVTLLDPAHVGDERRMLVATGQLWCAGLHVRWPSSKGLGRVPLPTYAFERERHWLDPTGEPAVPKDRSATRNPIQAWFYAPSWKLLRRPQPPATPNERVLVFGAGHGGVAEAWRVAGHDVRHIAPTMIDVDAPADFIALFDRLRANAWLPRRVVFAWQAEGMAPATALVGLLHLAQALSPQVLDAAPALDVLSADAFRVDGSEKLVPEAAMLAGAARVVADELHFIEVGVIDIDTSTTLPWATLTQVPTDQARVMALRRGGLWAELCEPVSLSSEEDTQICDGGNYLVTGGLGGIGKAVTRWLARTPGIRIALFGRRGLPERTAWPALIAASDTPATLREDIAFMQEIEAMGAQIEAFAVDMGDRASVVAGMASTQRRFGRVDGVFHLAGLPGRGLLGEKDAATIRRTLAPKIDGVHHLRDAMASAPPAFVLLFSSLSAVVGGIKQFDYAAANAHLDAFAQDAVTDTATRWLSIGWDAWRTGMAEDADVPEHLRALKALALEQAMSVDEGLDALERMLRSRGLAHIVVSTRDIASRQIASRRDIGRDEPSASAPASRRRPAQGVAYAAPRTSTESALATLWADALGYGDIGRHDNFFELGGDSLLATRVVASINARLEVDLGVRDFLESRHIEDLAGLVDAVSRTAVASPINPDTEHEQVW